MAAQGSENASFKEGDIEAANFLRPSLRRHDITVPIFYWSKQLPHSTYSFIHSFIHLFKFIYFQRERERMSEGGAKGGRGRERIPSRFRAASIEPDAGLKPMKPGDHDLS